MRGELRRSEAFEIYTYGVRSPYASELEQRNRISLFINLLSEIILFY